jgi:glycerophosphoryl diester phosphodiesterase
MVDLVVERGLLDRAVFISMDWRALDRMRSRNEALRIGYIVEEMTRADEGLDRAAGDSLALVDFRASLLLEEPDLCRRALDCGIDLAVWTVDDATEAGRLLALGVRRITTNRVSELLAWKASL